MTFDLAAVRGNVRDLLAAEGLDARDYTASIDPPCVLVVPARPYSRGPGPSVPFGCREVRLDVLMLVYRDGAEADADRIDEQIGKVLDALGDHDDYDLGDISQPGVIEISDSKYLGSVTTITTTIEETT